MYVYILSTHAHHLNSVRWYLWENVRMFFYRAKFVLLPKLYPFAIYDPLERVFVIFMPVLFNI